MNNRAFAFASLLAVVGASIVFGMLIGGRLNIPETTFAAGGGPSVQLAPASTAPSIGINFADIVDRAMPAVVSIRSTRVEERRGEGGREGASPEEWFWRRFFGEPPQQQGDPHAPRPEERSFGEGSGFIISADGYLLTNNHVVENADDVRVHVQSGRDYKAKVVGTDPSIDLALLKIDPQGDELPTLPLGDSDAARVGEWVIAIGNPLEFEQTVTVGVLSGKDRRVPIGNTDSGVVSFLQTDAAINFGNSGGPLLDSLGNVIGINTAIRRSNYAEGIGFALPISHARSAIEQLRERGYVRRGYIGIGMNQEGLDEAAREWLGLPDQFGVIVDRVSPGGPAAEAGLESGDVIRKVDGDVVRDNLDLISKVASRQPGDEVKLEVYRKTGDKGKILQLRVTLADREEGLRAEAGPGERERPTPERQPEEISKGEGLGLTVRTLDSEARQRLRLPDSVRGVIVSDVKFGTPAADKGVVPDLVVTAIDGQRVESVKEFQRAIDALKPGAPCKLDLQAGPDRSLSVFLRVPDSE